MTNAKTAAQKKIDGVDNVYRLGEGAVDDKLTLNVEGDGNLVEIGADSRFRNMTIDVRGRRNKVLIGRGCEFRGRLILVKGDDQTVRIGDFTTMVGGYLLSQEGGDITIGSHCLFSRDVEIRTTDAHSVVDLQTLERINKPAGVVIGDHVWMGVGVLVSKGVRIASDCVVGAKSGVFRDIDESHAVAFGSPAVVTRRGVT